MATSKIINYSTTSSTVDATENVKNGRLVPISTSGRIRYKIHNGICYVNINQMKFSGDCATMSDTPTAGEGIVATGLPKSAGVFYRFYYNESARGDSNKWHFFGVSNNGELISGKTTVDSPIQSFTFSYPCTS